MKKMRGPKGGSRRPQTQKSGVRRAAAFQWRGGPAEVVQRKPVWRSGEKYGKKLKNNQKWKNGGGLSQGCGNPPTPPRPDPKLV